MPTSHASNQEQLHRQFKSSHDGAQPAGLGKRSSVGPRSDSLRASMNREILEISQSFNTSPRPFSSRSFQLQPSACRSLSRANTEQLDVAGAIEGQAREPINQKQVPSGQELRFSPTTAPGSGPSGREQAPEQQASKMQSQRLVHRQYNSPINLNSMDNIRRTIEAHTEDIAPGIKGINFMKPEQPVNKQSAVYRLIMEEDEERDRRRLAASQAQQRQQEAGFSQSGSQPMPATANQRAASAQPGELAPSERKVDHQASVVREMQRQDLPACSECGLKIVGAFAKVQSRSIHPHCFNCTTCGTSLKNTGYYTVNEKLYCDIHARLMARVLRINYDFGELNEPKSGLERHLLAARPAVAGGQSQAPVAASTSFNSATSSVYASSLQSNKLSVDRGQQRVWGASGSSCQAGPAAKLGQESISAASGHEQTASSRLFGQQASPEASRLLQRQQHQQQHYLGQGGSRAGGPAERVPVCLKCSRQIHGPYILAGSSTWCKPCGQTSFSCNSCRRSLLNCGFIEADPGKHYCEQCYERHYAPVCSHCQVTIRGDCLRALGKQWHPSCFVCGHCRQPFGNSQFYLEDNVPYCLVDWNQLFTTKCYTCSLPIEAGDKFLEALDRSYHSNCFTCTSCHKELEGSLFYCKAGRPYCRLHVC